MIRRLIGCAALAMATTAQAETTKPTLLVVISVDQLSADLFAEYRAHFTGGLKRLSQGVVFPSGYQSHSATETCPGHSTILTGARPARNGIVANNWMDLSTARTDKVIYCAEDESVAGSTSKKYTVSAVHLKVPTLGERMNAADPRVRIVSVAGKDRAAVMMGGHRVDQLWYWTGKSFEGSAIGTPAVAVARTNAAVTTEIARAASPLPLSPLCALRNRAISVGSATIGTSRFDRRAGDTRAFRASPAMDGATIKLAGDIADELKLGRGPQTDVLIVGASGTDIIGHAYGTGGAEMCLQLQALDAQIGALFKRLDSAKIDYVVTLTADHGGHDAPERNRELAIPDSMRVDATLMPDAMGKALAAEMGIAAPLLYGTDPAGDIYVDKAITGATRDTVITRAKAAYLARPQVAAVFTAADIAATPPATTTPESWTLAERVKAGYVPGRSGDLIVLLKARVTPIAAAVPGYAATHGSPWDYDRRVPILFWSKGMAGFEQPNSIETVDIAPTLAALIGFPIPTDEMDGKCRDLIAGPASSCPPERQWYIGLDGKPTPARPRLR